MVAVCNCRDVSIGICDVNDVLILMLERMAVSGIVFVPELVGVEGGGEGVAVHNSGFRNENERERENDDNETVFPLMEKQLPLKEMLVVKTQFTISITELDVHVNVPISFMLFLKMQK
jgi:hypothetical protein